MNIPDCYDPIYQAEQLAAEADANALHCEECGHPIFGDYWFIQNQTLCDRCAAYQYRRTQEELFY